MSADNEGKESNSAPKISGAQSEDPGGYNWKASTPKLNSAFAKARAEFPVIPKNRTSEVKKDGKLIYKFNYADLADILAAVTQALSKYGLEIHDEIVEIEESRLRLWTILSHESGEMRRSIVPMPPNTDPQKWGGFLTYMRRYQAGAILGVASEEDDDGNRAAGNEHSTSQREKKGNGVKKDPAEPSAGGKPAQLEAKPDDLASTLDIKALFIQAKANKWTESLLKEAMAQLYDKDSTKKLTHHEISDLLALVKKFTQPAFAKAFADGLIVQDPDGRWTP